MDNVTQELAKFILDVKYQDLPAPVIHATKRVLLDSIGCALAGITTDPGKMLTSLAVRLGGTPESSIIGEGVKVSCTNAALANGQLINAVDYDALMPGAHTPPYIIPPQLAIGELTGASGKDLILATTLGFEIAARVYNAVNLPRGTTPPGGKLERQGYASANFGAAAGAGKLMKLGHEKMTYALGIAGHLSQVLTWARFDPAGHRPMTKYGMPGWQNTGGVIAVLLADMGYLGDTTVFDDREGFWKFAGYAAWRPDEILKDLGRNWVFTGINFKPYPCCRVLHPGLEAFLDIVDQNHLLPEEIESVKIFRGAGNFNIIGHHDIKSIVDIQFGLRFVLALAAYRVPVGVEWQDLNRVRDPKILEFAEKVTSHGNPETIDNPQLNIIEVSARGQTFTARRLYTGVRGVAVPGLEMTDAELVDKFRNNSSRILTEGKIESAIAAFNGLENIENISELMKLVTR